MAIKDKYLITGFSGFVSKHFLEYLEQNNIEAEIIGIDVHMPEFNYSNYRSLNCSFETIDLLNKEEVERIINTFKPNYILHLASYSSVAYSWKNPVNSFTNNTNIFLNLIESVRTTGCQCRILSIGSSEEYGNVSEKDLPLKEDQVLHPISPYAVARVSQEMLSKVYCTSYGLDIVMTRSFNHIGAGQKDVFVVPSFAKQLINLKKDHTSKKELFTGDTTIVRDFIDVKDVVNAYYLLFQKGKKGEIYNICSGKGTSLNEVISILTELLNIDITHTINPDLVRPNDNKIIIGCNQKIMNDTGWSCKIPLNQSLQEIIADLNK
ncbi:MAG: GDP-mannose 4,6-dehydratase [Bacteroidetes bacterium]|nr:GDP-mannose 4,6-dehydratase [Bacteroidota bacterium]